MKQRGEEEQPSANRWRRPSGRRTELATVREASSGRAFCTCFVYIRDAEQGQGRDEREGRPRRMGELLLLARSFAFFCLGDGAASHAACRPGARLGPRNFALHVGTDAFRNRQPCLLSL